MILHFGLHLDRMQPGPPRSAAGEAVLGPARLLELLEVRLGLPPVVARPGAALLAYRDCLAETNDLARFYRRSFEVDAFGTAKTLLDWRAQWYEAGWTGAFEGRVSQRLADLAAVERLARDRTPATSGQRLQRIAAELASGNAAQVERVVLHSDPADLPVAWRAVLEHFATEVATGVHPAASAAPGTDLHRIQRTLLELAAGDSGMQRTRQPLAGDDSVVVVRAISRDLSAQAVAEYVRRLDAVDDTLLLAEHDGIILDNALERVGLPRAGFQHYSRFRAVAQVLKLALGLLWEPIDPHALLQFLIHPVGPLPVYERSKLATAVAREPGIGGRAWQAAIAAIDDRLRTRHGRDDAGVAAEITQIRYWLENPRYDPVAGAPAAVVVERVQRSATWLARQIHGTDEDDSELGLYAAANAQAEALIGAIGGLVASGQATIPRIVLERLVDEVSAHAADPASFAQARHVRAATQPGAVTTGWRNVIWWDLAPRTPPLTYPWSDAELSELARERVALPPVEERIRRRVRTWLQPVMNARAQLVLVLHERDAGHHPLWSRLHSLFDGFNEVRIEDVLLGESAHPAIPVLDVPLAPLAVRPLPAPRRWWRLPADCRIPVRTTESYSSLRQIVYFPHEWVLAHAARLRRGGAADLPNENLLAGNLAHRLFETFFNAHPQWAALDERAVRAWLADFLPALLRQEGALLCEPGAAVIRERVLATLEASFARLLWHLRSAGLDWAVAEQHNTAPFKDVRLEGTIDLLLRARDGREVVLDVKWGSEDFRGAELSEDRYLQLATYAYLRRAAASAQATDSAGHWPHYAYYIVASGNVLAHDNSVFPHAILHPPVSAQSIAALWARVGVTYDWRRAQLAAGLIEIITADTAPTAESTAPPAALAAGEEADRFDEFTWLTGWDPGE